MKKLIIASNNKHKIREISEILEGSGIEILSAGDFKDFPDVEETGATLRENAVLKARAVWELYSIPCIADDTGLEVDFLDGAPGVYSARFAGEDCSYDDNNAKLKKLLEGVPLERRTACFKTVIAFIDQYGSLRTAEGKLDGIIAAENRGQNGFGYDPLFYVVEKSACLAELSSDVKNGISHRGRAVAKIAPIVKKSFKN